MASTRQVTTLADNWRFKRGDKEDEFKSCARFPTQIHLDLMKHNLIPDPYIGKNENDVQWVGETPWVYAHSFPTPNIPSGSKAVLAFDGLDTFATVTLNGHKILETDNMFIPYRVDVTSRLNKDLSTPNDLQIRFESAYLKGWKRVEEHPDHKWGCWNGDSSRLAVRKAQYHWGWDWGPALNTCGPWRPIRLEVYQHRLEDVWAEVEFEGGDLGKARVQTRAKIEGVDAGVAGLMVQIKVSLDGQVVATQASVSQAASEYVITEFSVEKPALWYPRRYGAQPLYDLEAVMIKDGVVYDSLKKKIGIRKAKLIQKPLVDQPGTSFYFEVNDIPIYCGGSDWIPADNFITRIDRQRYYDWVKLAADGNQGMIRVWGGGIYEEQDFYDACDEYGILVWQDFMFGCGNYPAWPELRESIQQEAVANVKALRHHPSIVIWAGNNEDYQYQESEGLTYDYANKDAESWLKTDFPARYIYEKILADVCADLVPDTAYHYGSPWGGGVDTHDPTVGDIHQWNVWHGTQEKYQDFDTLIGRFVSEFGMEAFPSIKTIDSFLPLGKKDPDRYPQSSTVDFHNKAAGHERRIALYLVENLRYAPDPIEQFVYATQLMQAECLASAYRLWKRQWKGPGREYCGGTLVWQLNDCWPVTSWSIVDYYLRPKMAYWTVKREMEGVSVGVKRVVEEKPRKGENEKYTRVMDKVTRFEVWGCNLGLESEEVELAVKGFEVESGKCVWEYEGETEKEIQLEGNQSTELEVLQVSDKLKGDEDTVIVAAYLISTRDGSQLARYIDWPQPLKYLNLQQPKKLVVDVDHSKSVIKLSAEVPVKGVALECDDDGVVFEDNLVDLVPEETVTIKVRGLKGESKITTRYLGMTT